MTAIRCMRGWSKTAPLLAALGVLSTQSAAAKPAVLFIPYQPIARQATPELAAQVTKAMAAELATADAYELKAMESPAAAEPAQPTAETPKSTAGQADLAKAAKLVAAAEKLQKKYRFDQAIENYQRALEAYAKAAPAVEDVDAVARVWVNLGVAAFRRGKEDLAEQAFAAAVVLTPERRLDETEYPPLLLRVYDDVMRKTLRAPRGAINVDVGVAGAEVFFNGRSVGATPIKLTGVPPGHHYVRVVKEGAGSVGVRVEVEGRGVANVEAKLAGARSATVGQGGEFATVAAGMAGNVVDAAVVKAAATLAKREGCDYALFGGVRRGEASIPVATFMVDAGRGVASRLVDIDVDLDMLSVSIEAFKLSEDMTKAIQAPGEGLGDGPQAIVRGVAGETRGGEASEVDVGVAVPGEGQSITAMGSGRRPVGGEPEGDSGGEGGQRTIIDTGSDPGGRRLSMSDDDALSDRPARTIAEIDEPDAWYENPWMWVGAGTGGALLVGGATLGVVAFLMTRPPSSVQVTAEWP